MTFSTMEKKGRFRRYVNAVRIFVSDGIADVKWTQSVKTLSKGVEKITDFNYPIISFRVF